MKHITKPGKVKNAYPHQAECPKCKCEFTYEADDEITDPRDPGWVAVACPTDMCLTTITIKKARPYVRRETE